MLDRIIWNHPWSPLLYLIFITNCLMAALVGAPVASVHAIRCERSNYKFKLVHSILITRCIYLFESNGMAIYNGRLNIAVTFQGRFDKSRNKIELVQLPPKDNLLDLHVWNNLTGELDQIAYGTTLQSHTKCNEKLYPVIIFSSRHAKTIVDYLSAHLATRWRAYLPTVA
jgi:hypothetical protein